MMTRHSDLLHKTFGRLQVIAFADHNKTRQALWRCLCTCGRETTVVGAYLTRKRSPTQSCGSCASRTHGLSHTVEYNSWGSMKTRCYNTKDAHYPGYGARGIVVCDRWIHSFENFLADMGLRPSLQHSLDRYPNMNGNYEPGNCRWATKSEQTKNTRKKMAIESFSDAELWAEVERRKNFTKASPIGDMRYRKIQPFTLTE